jgi:hypothetical protein
MLPCHAAVPMMHGSASNTDTVRQQESSGFVSVYCLILLPLRLCIGCLCDNLTFFCFEDLRATGVFEVKMMAYSLWAIETMNFLCTPRAGHRGHCLMSLNVWYYLYVRDCFQLFNSAHLLKACLEGRFVADSSGAEHHLLTTGVAHGC